jgi:uncharacterized protein (DUF302 family)
VARDLPMTAPDWILTVRSVATVAQVVERLRTLVADHGLTLFADVDHAANAREAGLEMPPSRVLIFGNARAGTPLMLAAPDIALELPLRVLVREDAEGAALVYLDPVRLAAAFGVEHLAAGIMGLSTLVEAAAATRTEG